MNFCTTSLEGMWFPAVGTIDSDFSFVSLSSLLLLLKVLSSRCGWLTDCTPLIPSRGSWSAPLLPSIPWWLGTWSQVMFSGASSLRNSSSPVRLTTGFHLTVIQTFVSKVGIHLVQLSIRNFKSVWIFNLVIPCANDFLAAAVEAWISAALLVYTPVDWFMVACESKLPPM